MNTTDHKPSWIKRHKIVSFVIMLLIIIFLASAASSNTKENQTMKAANDASLNAGSHQLTDDEKMTISNTSFSTDDMASGVTGEIRNNDTVEHSATLKATFYDKSGKIVGTAEGAVNSVAPNETKTFNLLSATAIPAYATMKVQIDTLI